MSLQRPQQIRRRHKISGAGLVEYGPSLIVLILVVFPAINLIGLVCGAATICLTARQCATRASTAHSLTDALTSMRQEGQLLVASGLGQFSKLRPILGYASSGADLYIKQTNIYNSQVTVFGPNAGIPPPVDTASNVFEASVKATFEVGPLLDLSVIPGLDDIPALGKPAEISITWDRVLEHPDLFSSSNNMIAGTAGSFSGSATSGSSTGSTGSSVLGAWNYPSGGRWQAMPGQKILQTEDITVQANDPNWLATNVVVEPGNRLTFDFLSNGSWRGAQQGAAGNVVDADGMTIYSYRNMPFASLVGRVGDNGPLFFIGKDQWNFTPPNPGILYLEFNDGNREDNSGIQNVRVYRTN